MATKRSWRYVVIIHSAPVITVPLPTTSHGKRLDSTLASFDPHFDSKTLISSKKAIQDEFSGNEYNEAIWLGANELKMIRSSRH